MTTRDAATGPVPEIFGELDYDHAPRLRQLLATVALRPGRRLALDLGGMEFCDSSAISSLIAAHHHAQAARADVALATAPASTPRTLRIVGLDQVFAVPPLGNGVG
ncbi:STAS domain-containing protein [Streptomyces eurythermus]|uniref:STAS domain-containing protein n=1 Tax=Streptomyces eurythermus TaxID=42237 RepID=UPI003681C0AB